MSFSKITTIFLVTLLGISSQLDAQELRPAAATLKPVNLSDKPKPVDKQGFIRRWLVLDPIALTTGTAERGFFTGLREQGYQEALQTFSFPNQLSILPKAGDTVLVKDSNLKWHALDTSLYNFNLYHFAWSNSKPTSNVLFWAVTWVEAPEEMKNVRLAIGSNAASNWWLNDEKVIELYGDRQAVVDDGVSKRLTLRKGKNLIRVAVINGGGATDFCARFLDENDNPITHLRASL